ncbi:MAG: TAXI family TRAP transporter solute-binding subunit, partial [Pyramidobacter sp.]|nr:TAXI family TRAP transporter solute-binding subunit [Pyramidobacter sp.]
GFTPYKIPAGTYSGQKEDVHTVGLPMILFTRKNVDEDTVYELTKTICENAGFLKTVHSSFKTFDPNTMHLGAGIDLHPGALRFYREKGLIR